MHCSTPVTNSDTSCSNILLLYMWGKHSQDSFFFVWNPFILPAVRNIGRPTYTIRIRCELVTLVTLTLIRTHHTVSAESANHGATCLFKEQKTVMCIHMMTEMPYGEVLVFLFCPMTFRFTDIRGFIHHRLHSGSWVSWSLCQLS